ncbi:DMT family transporter [Zavarzinia aquatilis]|uniref:QacE family quaternary ammonium compound efflux SMR transporter n=1 Tax=Zavarzinia aquatilis TaxID=2211142 RepID=A0A317ECJ5_9PROT|nr:multidrug efflux SMR transporter [Zavarzinia aquatilis]PWR24757.1 QacE family quaternary ammonium compound efflux SMR transporter [Zavarzinia aquatilis]
MSPLFQAYAFLCAAILCELSGTSFLQASQQFTRPLQTGLMAISYLTSFYLMSHALKIVPVSIAYAIWSGLGIVLITIIGFVVFKQKLDLPALAGVGLIVAGVIVVTGFSNSVQH